ncbi:MAG: hypothetical protein WCW65_02635, partial [Candidatus Paceibacterota bacterium]
DNIFIENIIESKMNIERQRINDNIYSIPILIRKIFGIRPISYSSVAFINMMKYCRGVLKK